MFTLHDLLGKSKCTLTTLGKEEIQDNHRYVLYFFAITTNMNNWIFLHSVEYLLNYRSVLAKNVMMLGILSCPSSTFWPLTKSP